MKKILILLILLSSIIHAGSITCHKNSVGNSYCQYTGKLRSVYANISNLILAYFEAPFDKSVASEVGFNVANTSATIVDANENKIFADYFYATALSALTANKKVTIQMTSVKSGYLKVTNIWISSN